MIAFSQPLLVPEECETARKRGWLRYSETARKRGWLRYSKAVKIIDHQERPVNHFERIHRCRDLQIFKIRQGTIFSWYG